MRTRFLHNIQWFLISIFMLTVTVDLLAKQSVFRLEHKANVSSLAKADDNDKNITASKVMYNPIASQINVNFKLSKQSTVVIKLMDALGNEVLSLSNGALDEGNQNMSFDVEGKVSQGFYFVKISSGLETVIKRVSIR